MRYLALVLLFLNLNLFAQESTVQVPALTSPVMDLGNFLTPDENRDLSGFIREIHMHQGPQITILTVPELQGFPIEEFSIRVAEKWQLGTKEKGNGLLIIISRAERAIRIEVGEGIEGDITDFDANQYINQILKPAFREGKFHEGLRTVLQDIARRFSIKLEEEGAGDLVTQTRSFKPNRGFGNVLPILLVIMGIVHMIFRRKPMARGLFTGVTFAGLGYMLIPGAIIGIIMFFIIGLIIGLVGLTNFLFALASSGRGGRGGFGGGGFGGGGGWSGGGGGFSGGGSSGSW